MVRCGNIFYALHHLWRARCSNIFAQSIRTLEGGGGTYPPPLPMHPSGVRSVGREAFGGRHDRVPGRHSTDGPSLVRTDCRQASPPQDLRASELHLVDALEAVEVPRPRALWNGAMSNGLRKGPRGGTQGMGTQRHRGNVDPGRAPRGTFAISTLALAPSLSSPQDVRQVDRTGPQTFPAKHVWAEWPHHPCLPGGPQ